MIFNSIEVDRVPDNANSFKFRSYRTAPTGVPLSRHLGRDRFGVGGGSRRPEVTYGVWFGASWLSALVERSLGPVDNHVATITSAARCIAAAKLSPYISQRVSIARNSLILERRFPNQCISPDFR